MILTRNRLKTLKKVEDDDMLNYLKYSHLEPVKEDNILKVDEATQYPDIRNNFTQTKPMQISDKETDTYDDLNKMDRNARYILKGYEKGFKNDKQTQVNSYLTMEYEPKPHLAVAMKIRKVLLVGMLEGALEWQSLL